jgi:hypothetical protein
VGERQVADAEREQHPQHAQRPRDRVAALGAEQRRDLARPERIVDVGGGQREPEPGGVVLDHPVHEVDLLEHGGHSGVARQLGRDVDRPELAADAALDQPRYVGVGVRQPPGQVGRGQVGAVAVAELPGQVVVPVDEREAAEHRAGQREGKGGGVGSCHRHRLTPRRVPAAKGAGR